MKLKKIFKMTLKAIKEVEIKKYQPFLGYKEKIKRSQPYIEWIYSVALINLKNKETNAHLNLSKKFYQSLKMLIPTKKLGNIAKFRDNFHLRLLKFWKQYG